MLLALIILVVAPFGVAVIFGAPYLPILRSDSLTVLDLAGLRPGQTLIDLGSGDGRLLRLAASKGIRCIGYEINPFMVFISKIVCWRYRSLVSIRLADFWHTQLPPCDAVYVFLLDRLMIRLDKKLSADIKQPTKVVSFVFKIPGRKPTKTTSNSYVYLYGDTPAQA